MFKVICLLLAFASATVSAETINCRKIANSRKTLIVNGEVRNSLLAWPLNANGYSDCAGIPDGPMYYVQHIQATAYYPAGLQMFLFHCAAGQVFYKDSDSYNLMCSEEPHGLTLPATSARTQESDRKVILCEVLHRLLHVGFSATGATSEADVMKKAMRKCSSYGNGGSQMCAPLGCRTSG